MILPYYHAPDVSEGSDRMRGSDEQTSGLFSYLSPEQRVRQDHPRRAIRRMTDEVLGSLSPRFSKMYSDISRPSIPPEQLLRAVAAVALPGTERTAEREAGLPPPVSSSTAAASWWIGS